MNNSVNRRGAEYGTLDTPKNYVFGTDPSTADNGRILMGRTAKMPTRTRPVNSIRQAADGTGRPAVYGSRHTRKNGDGGQPYRLHGARGHAALAKLIFIGSCHPYHAGPYRRHRGHASGAMFFSGMPYQATLNLAPRWLIWSRDRGMEYARQVQ
ncbi:hypothetical protein B0H11DRAFT_1905323 [Mycena galericulata]|nr:hypothetical protein B0H11DRAFT_1905323 [Mycena galericulata]